MKYHTTFHVDSKCGTCLGMIDLKIQIEKTAPRRMSFKYTITNTGTLDFCQDIHICSEKFGKICLDRDVFGSGMSLSVEKTLDLVDFDERNVVDSATAFARVDEFNWVKSEKLRVSVPYIGNLVNCLLTAGAGFYEMLIQAHPYNDDVIRQPFFFLTAGPSGEIVALPDQYWDPGTAAIGLPVQSPNDAFSFTVPLVDLIPGATVFFNLLCNIRRKPGNLQPGISGQFFYRQGVESPVTVIDGSWVAGNATGSFLY